MFACSKTLPLSSAGLRSKPQSPLRQRPRIFFTTAFYRTTYQEMLCQHGTQPIGLSAEAASRSVLMVRRTRWVITRRPVRSSFNLHTANTTRFSSLLLLLWLALIRPVSRGFVRPRWMSGRVSGPSPSRPSGDRSRKWQPYPVPRLPIS